MATGWNPARRSLGMVLMLSWMGVLGARLFAVFERVNPTITLLLWSVIFGIAILVVFRLTSRPEAIRRAKNRVYGLMLDMWLHGDEPVLVWRAQRALVGANLKYLGLLLVPILVVTPVAFVCWVHLDQLLGRMPVPPGQSTILTVQFNGSEDVGKLEPRLSLPDGFTIDTPALRALGDGQVCWRVRAEKASAGDLRINLPGASLTKEIAAGTKLRYVSVRRSGSAMDVLEHPGEAVLPRGPVKWIEISYPPARHDFFGTRWPWEVWFILLSSVVALALRKRFGVTF